MKKLVAFILALITVVLSLSACDNNKESTVETEYPCDCKNEECKAETESPCDCGNEESKTEAKSLYAEGLEVVQLMSEMIQPEGYVNLIFPDGEIKTFIQEEISTGDYSSPKAVYAITISDEYIDIATPALNKLVGNLSEELKTYLWNQQFHSIIVTIYGASSVSVRATNGLKIEKPFVNENATDNAIYLYTYENAKPIAVTFIVGEDHIVSAKGEFVLNDKFACGSADEIKASYYDIIGSTEYNIIEVTEVQPE